MLTQEEVAARLQREVGVLQRQLSAEHNLVVEAQVVWLPTLCWNFCSSLPSVVGMVSVLLLLSFLHGR